MFIVAAIASCKATLDEKARLYQNEACTIASIRTLARTTQTFCLRSISPSHDSRLIHVKQASLNVFTPFPECERTCFSAVEPRNCVLLGISTSSNIKIVCLFHARWVVFITCSRYQKRNQVNNSPAVWLLPSAGIGILFYSSTQLKPPLLSTVIPCHHFTIRASISFTHFSLPP